MSIIIAVFILGYVGLALLALPAPWDLVGVVVFLVATIALGVAGLRRLLGRPVEGRSRRVDSMAASFAGINITIIAVAALIWSWSGTEEPTVSGQPAEPPRPKPLSQSP